MTWQDELIPPIRIVSCNVQDALGDEARAPGVVEWLHGQKPMVAVVHEAYRADRPGVLKETTQALHDLGYKAVHRAQDADRRPEGHGILMFARRKHVLNMGVIPLAGRYAAQAELHDSRTRRSYKVIGYTGNEEDEQQRLNDIAMLRQQLKYSGERHALPTVLATDAYTLLRRGIGASLLYGVALLTTPWPTTSTAEADRSSGPVGHAERRLHRIHLAATTATGRAYRAYLDASTGLGLRNADDSMAPTGRIGGVGVKTHHVFVSQDVAVKDHAVLPPIEAVDATAPSRQFLASQAILATVQLQYLRPWL